MWVFLLRTLGRGAALRGLVGETAVARLCADPLSLGSASLSPYLGGQGCGGREGQVLLSTVLSPRQTCRAPCTYRRSFWPEAVPCRLSPARGLDWEQGSPASTPH